MRLEIRRISETLTEGKALMSPYQRRVPLCLAYRRVLCESSFEEKAWTITVNSDQGVKLWTKLTLVRGINRQCGHVAAM